MMLANLFDSLPDARDGEVFTELVARPGLRLERIVSLGQATPADAPMIQDRAEWVLLLQGSARLRIEGFAEVALRPGDYLRIEAGQLHWVTWTDPDRPTLWLALHFD